VGLLVSALALLAALVASPGGTAGQRSVPALTRVAVVVMENHEYGQVIGSKQAPWITRQARRGGLATRYFAITHPSLPNYLAMLGGATFGIHDDCTGCHTGATNLVDQLEAGGISWRAYMESMPRPCYKPTSSQDEQGRYAKRHNPFFYFDDIRSNPSRCGNVVPLSGLASDISSGTLPRFIWITPNLCNDMHDCSVRTGDRWAKRTLPALVNALGPNGVLFFVFDEGTSDRGCCGGAAGGRVPLIAIGPAANSGTVEATPVDHYALLRTVEEAFGLPPLRNAANAGDLGALLR
jgi:phosphatidylinositol-3-phosphatase